MSTRDIARLAAESVELIVSLQEPGGAYPASPTFSAYRGYSWFRDGAFIADGVSSAGAVDSASAFFDWCSRILVDRRDQVEAVVAAASAGTPLPDNALLATRFTFDGQEGDDEWWDFQLDGYGTWLWAVVDHAQRHGLDLSRWRPAIELSVDYLISSWSRPCFDWWEEHDEHVHVSTLGCIAGGLAAVLRAGVLGDERETAASDAHLAILDTMARQGTRDGHLTKWLGSLEVDGSLAALVAPLGVVDGSVAAATVEALERDLTVDGGTHRFRADTFFGGGQWPLLSCFLGLAHARLGNRERARELLEWAASTATDAGDLPEQVDRHLLDPSMQQEWIDRWGTAATPLLWSHAMLVRLAVELDVLVPTPGASA